MSPSRIASCPFIFLEPHLERSSTVCLTIDCQWWIEEKERCAMNQAARALTALAGLAGEIVVPRESAGSPATASAGETDPPQNAANGRCQTPADLIHSAEGIARCHEPDLPAGQGNQSCSPD